MIRLTQFPSMVHTRPLGLPTKQDSAQVRSEYPGIPVLNGCFERSLSRAEFAETAVRSKGTFADSTLCLHSLSQFAICHPLLFDSAHARARLKVGEESERLNFIA